MRVPLSWLKEFAGISDKTSAEEISRAFVNVGFEVEEIEYPGRDLSGQVVVGVVRAIEEITDFKKPIRWVELDCGEASSRFVICGAFNFSVGDLVPVVLPGAVLPGNFTIARRETYGKISDGMICSARELGLGQEHDGIIVLPKQSAKPGDDAVALLQISDVIFDIAVNPDRGYALSIRGMAREIAAALGVSYIDPISNIDLGNFPISNRGVKAKIVNPSTASIIYLRTLEEFDPAAATPLWMVRRIEKCGMRSISLAVDVTNYVMLELGQPLHAFDREKISGVLQIRLAEKGESIQTLDGQNRKLRESDLLIADEKKVLALAGTMGGTDSEVSPKTTSLCIEAARFDPILIARNSKGHKIPSEAAKRFERGVDHSLAKFASARAAELLIRFGGAIHIGSNTDGAEMILPAIDFDPHFASVLTGAQISMETAAAKLELVGCSLNKSSDSKWRVSPAPWRGDLQSPADLVEEVARMIGYDAIPSLLPPHPVSPGLTDVQQRRRWIANMLADKGLVEVQSYPFVSEATMALMGFTGDRAKALRITNPMSEDLPLLRTHLIPGLLEVAQRNLGRGARSFAIFEMGSIFRALAPLLPINNPGVAARPQPEEIASMYASVPYQAIHVGAVLVGAAELEDWQSKGRPYDWRDTIEIATSIIEGCNFEWKIERSDFAPWHPGRCAELLVDGKVVAHAGELHPRVVEFYGLPPRACAFVLNLDALPKRFVVRGETLRTMPVAVQDIALIVDSSVPAAAVEGALRAGAGDLLESIALFDRYDKIGEGKISLAFTLTFRAPDRTLTAAEVSAMREAAAQAAFVATGAIVRSQ